MAQWKRAGPITQRSVDRNYAMLVNFSNFSNGQTKSTFLALNFMRNCVKVIFIKIFPVNGAKIDYLKLHAEA